VGRRQGARGLRFAVAAVQLARSELHDDDIDYVEHVDDIDHVNHVDDVDNDCTCACPVPSRRGVVDSLMYRVWRVSAEAGRDAVEHPLTKCVHFLERTAVIVDVGRDVADRDDGSDRFVEIAR